MQFVLRIWNFALIFDKQKTSFTLLDWRNKETVQKEGIVKTP